LKKKRGDLDGHRWDGTAAFRAGVVGGFVCFDTYGATAAEAPVNILFIGNSFTHGRYEPVRTYNGGFGANDVHDLLCSSPAACSSAAQGVQVDPAKTPPPGATLAAQLADLQANPSLQYNEPGPHGGVAGIFLQFTREAHLNYSVSLIAVSSATLTGYLNNTGNERRPALNRGHRLGQGGDAGPELRSAAVHDHGEWANRGDTRQFCRL
jgi:hypothetical protein